MGVKAPSPPVMGVGAPPAPEVSTRSMPGVARRDRVRGGGRPPREKLNSGASPSSPSSPAGDGGDPGVSAGGSEERCDMLETLRRCRPRGAAAGGSAASDDTPDQSDPTSLTASEKCSSESAGEGLAEERHPSRKDDTRGPCGSALRLAPLPKPPRRGRPRPAELWSEADATLPPSERRDRGVPISSSSVSSSSSELALGLKPEGMASMLGLGSCTDCEISSSLEKRQQ